MILYLTCRRVKKIATILLLIIFLFVSIVMPYGNFEDTNATRLLYNGQQKEDPDLDMSEFIFEKLLLVGGWFEQEEDEDEPGDTPPEYPQPLGALHMQSGFLDCYQPILKTQELREPMAKPGCMFKENKFDREFSFPIFHPPSFIN
jgi:hypothetical protein